MTHTVVVVDGFDLLHGSILLGEPVVFILLVLYFESQKIF